MGRQHGPGTGNKLAPAGVVIAVLGIAIGAFTAIDPQEGGCLVHLKACSSNSSSKAGGNGGPSSAASGLAPSPTPPGILPGFDPSLPYPAREGTDVSSDEQADDKRKPGFSGQPRRIGRDQIMVTGSGFTRNGILSTSLYDPEGGTFLGVAATPWTSTEIFGRHSSGIRFAVTENLATMAREN